MAIMSQAIIEKQLSDCGLSLNDITSTSYFGIYHASDWDGGFEYEDSDDKERKMFYLDMQEMFMFLKDFINETGVTKCILGKFHRYEWFENWSNLKDIDIYQAVNHLLSENGLSNNSPDGLEIDNNKDWNLITKIIEGGFRYISHGSFFFPQIGIILEPTHNFEFLFFMKDINPNRGLFNKLVNKNNNLSCYDEPKLD